MSRCGFILVLLFVGITPLSDAPKAYGAAILKCPFVEEGKKKACEKCWDKCDDLNEYCKSVCDKAGCDKDSCYEQCDEQHNTGECKIECNEDPHGSSPGGET